jgi:adenylate cyclase
MANAALSPGVKLAWQLAGDLAVREKSAILPRHILYGICSVGKLLDAQDNDGKDRDAALAAKPEVDRLNQLSERYDVDLSSLRRDLRNAGASLAATASQPLSSQRVSRSSATKQIFEVAAQSADKLGSPEFDLILLFRATVQAHDAELEKTTSNQKEALLNAAQELDVISAGQVQFSISLDSRLKDLDRVVPQDSGPFQIAETLDASIPFEAKARPLDIERLAALSELTWECGTRGLLDSMLQKSVDLLPRIVGKGERVVILIRDLKDNELLLKACGPPGAVPMISMTSAKRAIADKKGFIWKRGEDLTLSQKEASIEAGMYVPLVINDQSIGVICMDCFCPQQFFERDDLLLVTTFAHQLALAIAKNADVLERLLTNFSPKVRTHLLQRAQMGRLRLGGEKSVVSVLCADIRGFARMTADMATDDVVSLLNEYFAALTECIFRNDGTIDKFVGDAILAVFGSPEADPQHCRKAVLAGIDMQAAAQRVNERRKTRGEVTCEIGIGVHTGEVLHGFIGSSERMEFTVIGDTVNRASRYCDGAKGREVLISPEVHERTWKAIDAQQITIPTKHEGDFIAYRVDRVRERR